MRTSAIAPALPVDDACPPALRAALTRWKAGELTGVDLCEASKLAALDVLDDYRWRPLPTPPEEVAAYRRLSAPERDAMDDKKHVKLHQRHAEFYAQDAAMRQQNAANAEWLQELLTWAQQTTKGPAVIAAIRQMLFTHQTQAVEVPHEQGRALAMLDA